MDFTIEWMYKQGLLSRQSCHKVLDRMLDTGESTLASAKALGILTVHAQGVVDMYRACSQAYRERHVEVSLAWPLLRAILVRKVMIQGEDRFDPVRVQQILDEMQEQKHGT